MFGFGNKKTAILIIPAKKFDKNQIHLIDKGLRRHRIKSIYASISNLAPIYGMHNEKLKVQIKIADIDLNQCDALVLVGGTGAMDFWNDMNLHHLLKLAHEKGKILAAIDYAPLTLAHAELLHDKKATVIDIEEQKLQASGAIYTGASVEITGNIITAAGPEYTSEFADLTGRLIQGEQIAELESET